MTRAIGLDLGSKRIGVAVSNSDGTLATPLGLVERSGDRAREHRRIAELVAENEADIVVVGLPLHLDGRSSPAATAAIEEADQLRATVGVPVVAYDERLTTVTAHRLLRDLDLTPAARRKAVDQVAATVMLQAWLDGRRGGVTPASDPPNGADRPS